MILTAFSDISAEKRNEERTKKIAADLRQGAETYQHVVHEVGFTPPTMTGMILQNAVMTGELSPSKLKDILAAMKYDTESEK
jgi:CRISPR/Cas system-associated endoribonuclease Cas2